MDIDQIAKLLVPFTGSSELSPEQLRQLSLYLDLLLRWNARTNLTAVRDAESIVLRHFGESLFAAQKIFSAFAPASMIDLGSGAGFPGIPLKICAPNVPSTLIESQNKKATFLKEVIRTLRLNNIVVFNGRAEAFAGRASLVTLRAVEHFEKVLPIAASLLSGEEGCRIALLIGETQVADAHKRLPSLHWDAPVAIPRSSARVLLVGTR